MKYYPSSYPFVRLLIPFSAGILASYFLSISLWIPLIFCALSAIFVFIPYKSFHHQHFFAISIYLFLFFAGMNLLILAQQKTIPSLVEKKTSFKGYVQDVPYKRYGNLYATVKTPSGILLSVIFKNDILPIGAGSKVEFEGIPVRIKNRSDSLKFDYQKYMAEQNLYYEVFVRLNGCYVVSKEDYSWQRTLMNLKQQLFNILHHSYMAEENSDFLSAISLGTKKELEPEIKMLYQQTGVSHILAVSGLHVGVIFVMLNGFFFFLKYFKKGSVIKALSIIACLWFYAMLTGLSPSVCRAVFMFSVFQGALLFKRDKNFYNAFAISAFFLLLINPMLLFNVSFQLSYTALFSIVYFYPIINRLLKIRYKVVRIVWSILSVSIAVQILTFPLCLYYFHQFPTYFLLSNLLITLSTPLFLVASFLLFIIHPIADIHIIYQILNKMISWQNQCLTFINSLSYSSIQNIEIDKFIVVLLYGIIMTTTVFLFHRKKILR